MSMTTIKVPKSLRDRLAERARREHTTLAVVIERTLEAADDAAFWAEVRATMGANAGDDLRRTAESYSGTLRDGLDPEDWSDVL